MSLLHKIGQKPIIAAVRNPMHVQQAIASHVDNLFFMGGNVKEIIHAVRLAKEHGKGSFVHLDLIKGLSSTDKESVDFIADYVGADGIVTPKAHLIREAKRVNLYGVLHLFILDSLALSNGLKMIEACEPDAIELMPGIVPKVIHAFAEAFENTPVIASGLVRTKYEVLEMLQAGATSLSVSSMDLWNLTFEDLYCDLPQ